MKSSVTIVIAVLAAAFVAGCATTQQPVATVSVVQIDYQIVAVDSDAFLVLTDKPLLDGLRLAALQKEGKARVISSQSVSVAPGLEATLKGVTEVIYPTAFDYNAPQVVRQQDVGNVGAVVEPSNFETREVGCILSVLPEVHNETICITLSPEVVDEPRWEEVTPTLSHDRTPEVAAGMKVPFFHSSSLQTTVFLTNEQSIVVGICPRPQSEKSTWVFLLGARLVR